MNKKALAVAISSALAVPMAAQAVSFNLSGQVNRAIMFADDGVASDVQFVDSTASNTRFRMTGSEDMGNGMKAGFNMEFASMVNSSFTVTIKQGGDGQPGGNGLGDGFLLRKNEVWFSGNWGKVSLGQGPTSTDGMADADLSNTWLSDQTAVSFGGGIAFRTGAGGSGGQTTVAGSAGAYTYFDGHSRRARVRYDSPSFGPLTVSVDASTNNTWGAKAYVYTSIAGGDLSAAFGYASGDNRFGRTDYGGSISYLFSQGTNIGFGWQERDFVATGVSDATHWRVKLGHRWGNNAVSISYGEVDALANRGGASDSEATKIGIGFVHTIPKPKVELYAGYMNLSLDDDGTGAGQASYEDIDVFHIGSRVKFD